MLHSSLITRCASLLLIVGLISSACHRPPAPRAIPTPSPSLSRPFTAESGRSYNIGVLLPFTGPMAGYGVEVLNGIQLATDRLNHEVGRRAINLVVRDTAVGSPIQKELDRLLDEADPVAVIGPLISHHMEAAAKVADHEKVPLITPSAMVPNVRQLSPYVFSTALTYPLQAQQTVSYAMDRLGYRQFGVIHPDSGYGRQLAQAFVEEARRQGGEVISVESYSEEETDFAKQITRLKSAYWKRVQQNHQSNQRKELTHHSGELKGTAAPRHSLDAIYLPGSFRHAVLIAAQLRFHDIKVRLLGSNAWHTPDLAHFPDKSIQGGIFLDSFFAESRTPAVRAFVEAYRARYHNEPSMFAVQAYEAVQVVFTGIAAGATSGKKLRAFLEQAESLPTLSGATSFNRNGILNRKLFVLQVSQNGQLIPLP